MLRTLQRHFLTGLLAITPLVITAWVLVQLYQLIDRFMRPWLQRIPGLTETYPDFALTTIAFHSDRSGFQELYLMDYDGRNQRRISGHKSTSGYSDWSPTGDAIAYMSYFSGTPSIYYVELATGNKVPVYRQGPLNLSPSFSPDGRFLMIERGPGSVPDRIHVVLDWASEL